jgi:hypothetical protein
MEGVIAKRLLPQSKLLDYIENTLGQGVRIPFCHLLSRGNVALMYDFVAELNTLLIYFINRVGYHQPLL